MKGESKKGCCVKERMQIAKPEAYKKDMWSRDNIGLKSKPSHF